MAISFDDSNAYRWTATKPAPLAKNYTITVEKAAPYKTRKLTFPAKATEKELRAFVEAAVAIPERVAPSKPTKTAASKPPNTPPSPSLPTKPGASGGAGMLILLVLAALLLGKKKGR